MEGLSNGSERTPTSKTEKRAECLLAGENLVLEMTAKGNSLETAFSKPYAEL